MVGVVSNHTLAPNLGAWRILPATPPQFRYLPDLTDTLTTGHNARYY